MRVVCAVVVGALVAAPAVVRAQGGTDIWLATMSVEDGRVRVGPPANVTQRPGYDNQPHFTPAGDGFWYTVIANGQADIARYDVASATRTMVTRTPESEYSPTPLPDGSGISVIRVEADSTQRLWRFAADGSSPALVLEGIAPVGYHAWADARTLALFVLGDPATLRVADAVTGAASVVAENIGRSIQRIPGRRAISFVRRTSRSEASIEELDPATGQTRPLVAALAGGEFHAWTPDGILLMADGARLYQWTAAQGRNWIEVADFTSLGLRMSRLAVSPRGDRIAIVAEEL